MRQLHLDATIVHAKEIKMWPTISFEIAARFKLAVTVVVKLDHRHISQ